MFAKNAIVVAASVGCLTLGLTGAVSAATTTTTTTTVQTYGPTVTTGWVSSVYGFSARDICRHLYPADTATHRQVNALGLSLTYKTVSSTSAETQGATSATSSVSGVQTLTGASALVSQCR